MRFVHKNNLIKGIIIILAFAAVGIAVYFKERTPVQKVDYASFTAAVARGEVAAVQLNDEAVFTFTYTGGETRYQTDNPRRADFKEELLLNGVAVTEGGGTAADGLFQLLFTGALIGGGVYVVSRRNGRLTAQVSFAAAAPGAVNGCGFAHVAGNAEAKESVADIVDYLKEPEKYARYGARMPKGILLHGRPGTGKTLMARAMAGEAGVPFYAVSGSDFVQMYVGVGAARVRELFKKAREAGKAVIFIDEIDALGKKRGAAFGNDEREQTLNALLTEMSGFNSGEGIIVVAATNRPDTLDEALLRPGRFDRRIEISLPDKDARIKILNLYAENKPLSPKLDLEKLAADTVFFSGAMLECLLNDAAINAAKRGAETIEQRDIDTAYYTALAGPEKKERGEITARERRVTAYHEAGHALVSMLAAPENNLVKVTIIPSGGGAGGFCVNVPPERMYLTKQELEQQIMIQLAGRSAEEVAFGPEYVTTGAANDIQKATHTAKQYVSQYGMCEETGLLYIDSERGNKLVLRSCKRLTGRLYGETLRLLGEYRSALDALADALMERETLSGDEARAVCGAAQDRGAPPHTPLLS